MTTTHSNPSAESSAPNQLNYETFKQSLSPKKVAVLLGAGVTIGSLFTFTQLYNNALALGGQFLSTAALLLIVDVVVDVIRHRKELRQSRKFRMEWAKKKKAELFTKTQNIALWSLAIALASVVCPAIPTILLTASACAVFTMGAQCLEHIMRKHGATLQNNVVLRTLKDAAFVMMPVLGYIHSTVSRLKNQVIQGVVSGFNWARDTVVHTCGLVFTGAQKFLTFLLVEGSKRFFSTEGDDKAPFVAKTA
jgi:hypothetical protein